ncbi:hypothetical protein B0H14DRAFT_3615766 [Mycena olivaceomarginata]|nr:hypothetical protein B0H14DRAFT_3615766 [Mycena olivaceomarginata]
MSQSASTIHAGLDFEAKRTGKPSKPVPFFVLLSGTSVLFPFEQFLVNRLLELVFSSEPIQVKRPPSDYTLGNAVIMALLPAETMPQSLAVYLTHRIARAEYLIERVLLVWASIYTYKLSKEAESAERSCALIAPSAARTDPDTTPPHRAAREYTARALRLGDGVLENASIEGVTPPRFPSSFPASFSLAASTSSYMPSSSSASTLATSSSYTLPASSSAVSTSYLLAASTSKIITSKSVSSTTTTTTPTVKHKREYGGGGYAYAQGFGAGTRARALPLPLSQVRAQAAASRALSSSAGEGGMSCTSRSMAVGAGVGGIRARAGTLGMRRRKKMWTSWEMQMERDRIWRHERDREAQQAQFVEESVDAEAVEGCQRGRRFQFPTAGGQGQGKGHSSRQRDGCRCRLSKAPII